jgi:putative redox protein
MVESTIIYTGSLRCEATHGPSGQTIVTDAPKDNMGKGEAFSPTDLVGAALGACMLTIMGIISKKNNINIDGAKAHVVKEMTTEGIRRIKKLAVTITLPKNYSDKEKKLLENGAMTCPVHKSLHPDVESPVKFVYPN